MNYYTKRAIHYSVFVSELVGLPAMEVYEKIGRIFLRENDGSIKKVLSDKFFAGLSKSLPSYLAYVNSFCDSKMIGQEIDEKEAIVIKNAILDTIERYKSAYGKDVLEHIISNLDEQIQFAVVASLGLFVKGASTEKYLPLLKRAKKSLVGIDAGIVLLALDEPSERERHFSDLKKCKIIDLYPEVTKEAEAYYDLSFKEKKQVDE